MQIDVTREEALAYIEDIKELDIVNSPREHVNTLLGLMDKMKSVIPVPQQ
jgi:hypothetical protein